VPRIILFLFILHTKSIELYLSECASMPGGEEFCREETILQYPTMNDTMPDMSMYGNMYANADNQGDDDLYQLENYATGYQTDEDTNYSDIMGYQT
jgi:hypothetical protein